MSWKKFSVGLDETKRIEFGFQKDRNWSQMNGTKIRLDFRVWELCSWTMIFRDTATILASSRYLFFRSFTRGKLGATEDNQKHIYIYIYIYVPRNLSKNASPPDPADPSYVWRPIANNLKLEVYVRCTSRTRREEAERKGCACVCVFVCVCVREKRLRGGEQRRDFKQCFRPRQ